MNPPADTDYATLVDYVLKREMDELLLAGAYVDVEKALRDNLMARDVKHLIDLGCGMDSQLIGPAGGRKAACKITRRLLTIVGFGATKKVREGFRQFRISDEAYADCGGRSVAQGFRDTLHRQAEGIGRKWEQLMRKAMPQPSLMTRFKRVKFDPAECANVLGSSLAPPVPKKDVEAAYADFLKEKKGSPTFKKMWNVWKTMTMKKWNTHKARASKLQAARKKEQLETTIADIAAADDASGDGLHWGVETNFDTFNQMFKF